MSGNPNYVYVDDQYVRQALKRLERSVADMAPAMRKIAGTLATVTDENFTAQGRPAWTPLSPATIHLRIGGNKAYKRGKDGKATLTKAAERKSRDMRILIDTAALVGSITTDYSPHMALIGSVEPYANIQHLGGMAGRGNKVEIPARPFYPADKDGNLQPEARTAILSTVVRHLKTAAGI